MSPEKMRILIAEACGWKLKITSYTDGSEATRSWVSPEGIGSALPDYLTDLNAMHEAEQFLNGVQQGEYAAELDKLAFTNLHEDFALIHATAAQRAEAFLKSIGKWEDESK